MASSMPLLLSFISMIFLSTIAPSMGSCSTRFSSNRVFASCLDLPALSASLHWTYNSNAGLTMAFVAPPATRAGWVAWGINPSRRAMLGTRALLAYRSSNGSIVADTYNITAYNAVNPSRIDYPVSGIGTEESGSNFVIFATLQLPANTTATNHVWQVGAAMRTGGSPAVHALLPANRNAVGTIDFARDTSGGPSPGPTSPSAPSPFPPATPGAPGNAGFHTVAASWSLLLVGLLHLLH